MAIKSLKIVMCTVTSANIAGLWVAGVVERTGRGGCKGHGWGCRGHTHSGRNVIARDLLSMSSELPLDCESDYRGV